MSYRLFKGYVETKNKKAKMAFKNKTSDDLASLKEVVSCDEYAGVLNGDTVLIDIDDYDQSEILMNIVEDLQLACRVYETTRGKHFVFRNGDTLKTNSTHALLACGLTSDIKLGCRNSLEILKYEGEERSIIYDIFEDEEYQNLPKFLTPTSKNIDFTKMEEGDGRNQELFNYILTLQTNDFSKDEAIETIKIINKYIFKEPLSDNEIDVILRDESFQKPIFFNKNKFLFDKFAVFIKNEHHIIKIHGVLHIYKDGVYVSNEDEIRRTMIKYVPNLKKQDRNEILDYINLLVRKDTNIAPAHLIAFNNGVYNLKEDIMLEFSPSIVIKNKIPHNYNPKAYLKKTDNALNKLACNDKNIRLLLEETIGMCFYRRNELRKAVLLKGGKRNGKSTFLDMMRNIVGDDNISSLDLKDLADRFRGAQVYGKLVNIGDDIDNNYIKDTATFKKLVSGDPITLEKKGRDPFTLYDNYCKYIFSANAIPRMGAGKDNEAVIDRLIIIPFDAHFSSADDDFDPFIKDDLKKEESLEYAIRLGIEGIKRVLKSNKFTTTDKVKIEIEEYEKDNDPILMYFDEIDLGNIKILNNAINSCYKRYCEFCIEYNLKPISRPAYTKKINKKYSYVSKVSKVNGKSIRVFVDKDDN